MNKKLHTPVLCASVIKALNIQPEGRYVDATYGRGGHTRAILSHLTTGTLLVLDKDEEAILDAKQHFGNDPRVIIRKACFSTVAEVVADLGWQTVDGILMDLGVSSPMLDTPTRGFSFMAPGPLDMRMDQSIPVSAADLVNNTSEKVLADIFWQYGEEKASRRIAEAIVKARAVEPITTTQALVEIITSVQKFQAHKHPATRAFQALRIAVNDELKILSQALESLPRLLSPSGRVAIISFHSLEDRIVKQFLAETSPISLRYLPVTGNLNTKQFKVLPKVLPSSTEITQNARSRSAVLRVAERMV